MIGVTYEGLFGVRFHLFIDKGNNADFVLRRLVAAYIGSLMKRDFGR